MNTSMLRLFVAINLPEELKQSLKMFQAELATSVSTKSVAWTRQEQYHLTLNFLGNVETGKAPALLNELRMAGLLFNPFELAAIGAGVFPNPRQPRVIWVGVTSKGEELAAFQKETTVAITKVCPLTDEKNFSGHITLGRAKEMNRLESQKISEIIAENARTQLGAWTCTSFELMRSDLSPNGAIHTVYESISLGRGG